jgi:peroxiredoxin
MLLNTPICNFGWQAPDFTLATPAGETHTFSSHVGQQGVLVVFLCNHCPYVQAIADRLATDAQTLQRQGIAVLGVMSNDYRSTPSDAPALMQRFAQQHGWTFPYLVDEGQHVGRSFDAVCTPDFFGFNNAGQLQYRGRLDNTGFNNAATRVHELVNAMALIATTGRGPTEQTASVGCSIKWAQDR